MPPARLARDVRVVRRCKLLQVWLVERASNESNGGFVVKRTDRGATVGTEGPT
jgi:hypothetical protein